MEEKIKKITCPNCGKTGNYSTQPNYCAYCGKPIPQFESDNHKK